MTIAQGRVSVSEYPKRMPDWLKKRLCLGKASNTADIVKELSLNTVCSAAACPNRNECFAEGTATFLIMGSVCSRQCTFCNVDSGAPQDLENDEPQRIAEAVKRMKLEYSVLTSVTRDDLPDGGSRHFADTVTAIHAETDCMVEVLTPDFQGDTTAINAVIQAAPEVYNHNLETVPRLYPDLRPAADYKRSLDLLHFVHQAGMIAKSGIMVGVGETDDELFTLFDDLRATGCRLLTIGQYLRPHKDCHPVIEYVTPDHFEYLKEQAAARGFVGIASSPFVRSSHHAKELYREYCNGA